MTNAQYPFGDAKPARVTGFAAPQDIKIDRGDYGSVRFAPSTWQRLPRKWLNPTGWWLSVPPLFPPIALTSVGPRVNERTKKATWLSLGEHAGRCRSHHSGCSAR